MPINEQELRDLATRIADAGKTQDAFGLPTDGQGNVVLPRGKRFLDAILALPQKYIIFADGDHNSHDQPFTRGNIRAMKANGVKHVFDEVNAREEREMQQERRNRFNPEWSDGFRLLMERATRIERAGMTLVASDPRPKDETSYAELIGEMHATENLLTHYLEETEGVPDTALAARLHQFTKANFPPAASDAMNTTKTAFFRSAMAVQTLAIHAGTNTAACQRVAGHLFDLASNQPDSLAAQQDITRADLIAARQRIGACIAELDAREAELDKQIAIESERINPVVTQLVKERAAQDKKAVLNWGLGHFDGPADIDDQLGAENTIVIVTVNDMDELDGYKDILRKGGLRDLPDYLYLSAENAADERAISVAEFLLASQRQQQAAEKSSSPQR